MADPKPIFACALKAAASGIILAHNHLSGSLQASQADIDPTKKLRGGGKLLDSQMLDHVIVISESYYSLDQGSCSLASLQHFFFARKEVVL